MKVLVSIISQGKTLNWTLIIPHDHPVTVFAFCIWLRLICRGEVGGKVGMLTSQVP